MGLSFLPDKKPIQYADVLKKDDLVLVDGLPGRIVIISRSRTATVKMDDESMGVDGYVAGIPFSRIIRR